MDVVPPLVERVMDSVVVEGAIQLQKRVCQTAESVPGSTQDRLTSPRKGQQVTVVILERPLVSWQAE